MDGWNQKILNNVGDWSRGCSMYGGEERCKQGFGGET